jgi:transcriptional regulator with XRE-family HTH domain
MNKAAYEAIRTNIRVAMARNKIKTIGQLAENSGLYAQTVSNVLSESRNKDIHIGTLIKIADALNVPVYRLLMEDKKSSEVQ